MTPHTHAHTVSAFHTGDWVRCFFGDEHRDGRVEHCGNDGTVLVRISVGWVHTARPGELLRIPPALRARTPEEIIRQVA